jgi:Aspartyl/Asparaginyl beta-hydroxylase
MTLPITLYLDRIPDLTADIIKLRNEYLSVENKLEDVDDHSNATLVQKKFHLIINDEMSEELASLPYTKSIVDMVFNIQRFNSVNYRLVLPNRCYNWHTDIGKTCVHIPLITNTGCRFVYDTKSFTMLSDGSIYVVNNGIPHTFMNAGKESRVHLTFENL